MLLQFPDYKIQWKKVDRMTIDFDLPIAENRRKHSDPFLVAHRGVCGANVPCNTLAAFQAALAVGADVIELDVTKSRDGVLYVFHPGMEPVYLQGGKSIAETDAEEVDATPLLNVDRVPTHYRVPRLSEAFRLLKDRVYINVDKYWTDVAGITEEIYRAGVEKQVIVKAYAEQEVLHLVEEVAPELMFMQMVRDRDTTTDLLLDSPLKFIGNELLISGEDSPLLAPAYLKKLRERGLLTWGNAIVYNESDVISAHHTDDASFTVSPDYGWGWFLDHGFDFIQTDWLLACRTYLRSRSAKSGE